MDRRAFMGSLVGGVATAAAVRTWPFRVYSFPTELKICPSLDELRQIYFGRALAEIDDMFLERYNIPPIMEGRNIRMRRRADDPHQHPPRWQ